MDAKKLEKAEIQIQKKLDKKEQVGTKVQQNRYKNNEATASQVRLQICYIKVNNDNAIMQK